MKLLNLTFILIIILVICSCEEEDFFTSYPNSQIIFISRRTENSAEWSLLSMNNDGTDQIKLTDLSVRYARPIVSRSGKTVLFVHYTDDHFYELYLIDVDGTNLTMIDRAKRFCGNPDWSMDDSKIIYSKSRNESTNERDLILFDVNSKNKLTLTDTDNNILGRFSKDNKIAFWRQINSTNDIYLMDIDGSNKQKIIPNASDPIWSPGGKRIAYISEGELNSPQIFVANSDGTEPKQLTKTYQRSWDSGFPSFGNYNPQWTSDSKKIVFQSDINSGLPEVYIMNCDGSNQQRLTDTDERNESPELSSDGKFILFTSNRDLTYNSEIYVMDIDGRNQKPISKYSGDDCLPVLTSK